MVLPCAAETSSAVPAAAAGVALATTAEEAAGEGAAPNVDTSAVGLPNRGFAIGRLINYVFAVNVR